MKKIIKSSQKIGKALLAFILLTLFTVGFYNIIIPDSISCIAGDELPVFAGALPDEAAQVDCLSEDSSPTVYTAKYKLLGVIPIKDVTVSVFKRVSLYVGGMPFGVKFSTDGVLVVGYGSDREKIANPAYSAGIRPSDIIKSIDGKPISNSESMCKALDASCGRPLSFTCERNGKEFTVKLTPYYSSSDGRYKSGLMIRDSGAGIGTVTYIEPNTNMFGGLGHGICDGETGALLPMRRGAVSEVTITGVTKGVQGTPGELHGSFKGAKAGSLIENTSCGVFGMLLKTPSSCKDLMEIGLRGELQNGKAYIYCTLDASGPQKYEIEISEIDSKAVGNKCFTVTVTDPKLIAKTGGIVQGMSGSPIIQNGRLVGAITHVLINDPTRGYGIFIENMLNATTNKPVKMAA